MKKTSKFFFATFLALATSLSFAASADLSAEEKAALAQAEIRIEGFENAPTTNQDKLIINQIQDTLAQEPDYKGTKKGEFPLPSRFLCPRRSMRWKSEYTAVLEDTKVIIKEDEKGVRRTQIEIVFGPSEMNVEVRRDEGFFCIDSAAKGSMQLGHMWISLEVLPTEQEGRIPDLDLKNLRISELLLKDLGLSFAGVLKWETKQDPVQFSAWLERNLNKVIAEMLVSQFKDKIEEAIRKAIEKYFESAD